MTVDWRTDLETARLPSTVDQDVWDRHWRQSFREGLARGLSPGTAALRAMNVTEMRHGERPKAKETKQ